VRGYTIFPLATIDYRLKKRTNGLPNVLLFALVFRYAGTGDRKGAVGMKTKLARFNQVALPTPASESAAALPSAAALVFHFSLLTFTF
jgi:hypothetical protein